MDSEQKYCPCGEEGGEGAFSLGTMSGCLLFCPHTQEFSSKSPMSHSALFKAILNP